MLTPKELYYAVKAIAEKEQLNRQHIYEVARWEAMSIINLTSTIIKKRLTDPTDLIRFPWEEEKTPPTQDELREEGLRLAKMFGATTRVKEDMDAPPLHLASHHKK